MNLFSIISRVAVFALMASGLSFAALADGASKFLGNTTFNGIPEDYGTYWNQITPERECTWVIVEKERGVYDWSGCDQTYNWAKENHATFSFRTLLWGSHYPVWLNGLEVDETKKAITDWFDAVQEHYPDLEMIEVVNEAVKNGDNYHSGYGRGNNFIEALGGNSGNYEFVVTAFKMARERWPKAILIYNDYNTIQWQKEQAIDLLKKIKAQGAPVDAFGMQFHETTNQGSGHYCLHSSVLKRALHEAHEQTGLPIYITQYDVGDRDDEFQKKCYMEHIPLLMETEYVAGITLWGYVYGKTWISCGAQEQGCSGLIKDGVERSAMTWLKEYFKNPRASRYGHGLANGAEKFLGNFIYDNQEIPEDFQTYWNQVSPDNACTWIVVEKEQGTYDFSECDRIYDWAESKNVKFKFRNLLWGSRLPTWLRHLDTAETKKAVEKWFDAVAQRYPELNMIEVVNEAARDSKGKYNSGFGTLDKVIDALGGDNDDYKFVATAFKMARKRWPYATLIYNDVNANVWQNNLGANVIQKIKEQHAPVDAYGLTAYNQTFQGSGPQSCMMATKIKKGIEEIYEQTKLPLFISEYSVHSGNDSLKKACYSEQIPVFMESEYIAGVTIGGYIYEIGGWDESANPGLIKDGKDLPAMTWLKDYFKEHFYDAKNMWYSRGIPINPLDSLDSLAFLDSLDKDEPIAISGKLRLEQSTLQSYDVFDLQGVRLGKLSAYGFNDAAKMLRASSAAKSSGIYFLRNRATGKMQSVGVAR